MSGIKFKYVLKHNETGRIYAQVFSLEEIEQGICHQWIAVSSNAHSLIGKLQFTGLLDKNGKEAYYEDFIRFVNTEGCIHIKKLWWNVEKQCTMVGNLEYNRLIESAFFQPFEFEIVGTSYENPEINIERND